MAESAAAAGAAVVSAAGSAAGSSRSCARRFREEPLDRNTESVSDLRQLVGAERALALQAQLNDRLRQAEDFGDLALGLLMLGDRSPDLGGDGLARQRRRFGSFVGH